MNPGAPRPAIAFRPVLLFLDLRCLVAGWHGRFTPASRSCRREPCFRRRPSPPARAGGASASPTTPTSMAGQPHALCAQRSDEVQHDLAPMRTVSMLDRGRSPARCRGRPGRVGPARRGSTSVSIALMCAGMSSGPSVRCRYRPARGAARSNASDRSCSTSGSAFSWIVSDAEVWRKKSVSSPSPAPIDASQSATRGGHIGEAGPLSLHGQVMMRLLQHEWLLCDAMPPRLRRD